MLLLQSRYSHVALTEYAVFKRNRNPQYIQVTVVEVYLRGLASHVSFLPRPTSSSLYLKVREGEREKGIEGEGEGEGETNTQVHM